MPATQRAANLLFITDKGIRGMKKVIFFLLVFFALCVPVHAAPIYAIIYANGAADLDSLTTAQKQSIVDRYVPLSVTESQAWQNASNAERWVYVKDNIIPAGIKTKITENGVLPILYHETAGFSIFQNWWKLAQEGTKYCFLVFLDYNRSYAHIKSWLDTQDGLKYWHGSTAWAAFKSLWNDWADPVALAIIKKVIRYPVTKTIDGEEVEVMVTIQEAIDLGYAIEESVLIANKKKVIPFRVAGYN